jgi:hypothetical protein
VAYGSSRATGPAFVFCGFLSPFSKGDIYAAYSQMFYSALIFIAVYVHALQPQDHRNLSVGMPIRHGMKQSGSYTVAMFTRQRCADWRPSCRVRLCHAAFFKSGGFASEHSIPEFHYDPNFPSAFTTDHTQLGSFSFVWKKWILSQ